MDADVKTVSRGLNVGATPYPHLPLPRPRPPPPPPPPRTLSVHAKPFVPAHEYGKNPAHQSRMDSPDTLYQYENGSSYDSNGIQVVPVSGALAFDEGTSSLVTDIRQDGFQPYVHTFDTHRQFEDLNQLEEQHEDLRDARDDLIGSRFRLRNQRRELQESERETTGSVAKAFDKMQRYFLSTLGDVPEELKPIFLDVETLRDALGTQQTDYEKSEEAYNLQEWRYTVTEKKFMDTIYNGAYGSSMPGEPFPAPDAMPEMSEFPVAIPSSRAFPAFPDDLPTLEDELTWVLEDSNDLLQLVPVPELSFTRSPIAWNSQDISPSEYAVHCTQRDGKTDNASHHVQWSETCTFIDKWLLDSLRASPFEQNWLKSLVPKGDLSEDRWWQLIIQHWGSSDPDKLEFHTGDTTAPESTKSEANSSPRKQESSYFPESESAEKHTLPPSPLLPEDRVIDALNPTEMPAQIKHRDLFYGSRHVTFLLQPSHVSLSEQMESGTYAVKRPETNQPSSSGDTTHPIQYRSDQKLDTKQHPSDVTGDAAARTPARNDTSEEVANGETSTPMLQLNPAVSTDYIATQHQSSGTEAVDQDHETGKSNSLTPIELFLSSAQKPESKRMQTRHPFAPFIRVKSPEPWSLPLLRLIPLPSPSFATPSSYAHSNRLENIPFVDTVNTPFRLPGPADFPMYGSASA